MKTVTIKLPKIGLGTWQLKNKKCQDSVLKALEIGYRLVDTAQMYGNEEQVGNALSEGTVPRNEIFLATKLFVNDLSPKKVAKKTLESLSRLKTEYLDLLYIHWPAGKYNPKKTLSAFETLVDEGKIKHIGISNFTPKLIDEALQVMKKPIFANQVENHPLLKQVPLRQYLKEKEIKLVSYSPLARGNVRGVPELEEIAKNHNTNPFQVSIAWEISKGAIPIPKASSEGHLRNNFDAQFLTLDAEEIQKVDSIQTETRFLNPPFIRPKW